MQNSIYSLILSVLFFSGVYAMQAQVSISQFNIPFEDDFTGFSGDGDPDNWTTFDDDGVAASVWQGNGNGSSNAGGKWSYGDAGDGANFDGSIGFLPSSSRAIFAEISFQNNTGATITELDISYVAEHWRGALSGRENGWTVTFNPGEPDEEAIPALQYIATNTYPNGANPDSGAWESVLLSHTLTGLSIPNGSEFTISFFGDNGTGGGSRQGVAIDDFSLTAIGTPGDDPLIIANPANLSGFEYEEGSGPSDSQTFELSGSDLDPSNGDLTVDAIGTDFEVSLDDNSYSNTLDIAYTGGNLSSTLVYVRLKEGLDSGLYENQEITVSGGDADDVTVTVSGEVEEITPPIVLPSLTAFNSPYVQDFSGFTDENSLPNGWDLDDDYSYIGAFGTGTQGGLRGEGVLGFQLTGSGMNSNFTATLQLVNDIGSPIEILEISYLGKVAFESRDGTPKWSVTVDGVEITELEYSTADGEDQLKTVLLTGLNIPDGAIIEIEWFTTQAGTSGQRRQIGATDVQVTALDTLPAPDAPEFDLAEDTYFENQVVMISNFGSYTAGVEVRFTTDGSAPGPGSELYDPLSGILLQDGNGTIQLRAVAINTNTSVESDETSESYIFPYDVSNIATFRAGDPGTLYRITGEVVLLHVASFQNRHFIRDNSGSTIVYDASGNISTTYLPGQGITGFTGERNNRNNGALQVMEAAINPGAATSFGNDISPVSTDLDGLSLDYTGNLVRVNSVDFVSSGLFSSGTTYYITDLSIRGEAQFRTDFFDADYIGENIPENTIDLTALVIGFGSNFQLVARSIEDFEALIEPLVIELINSTNVSCAGGEDGSIEVSVSGGSGGYSYLWTGPGGFSSQLESIDGLMSGMYHLTATDEMGGEATLSVSVSEPAAPELGFSLNGETLIIGETVQLPEGTELSLLLEEVLSGESPFEINWAFESASDLFSGMASGLSAGDEIFSLTPPVGTYTLNLSDFADAGGCENISEGYFYTVEILSLEELEFANFLANPSNKIVAPGEEFQIDIRVQLSLLTASAAEAHLQFDPDFLEVVEVTAGDWETGQSQTIIFNEFDNAAGTIDFAAFQLSGPFPENTIFDFFTITFNALAEIESTEISHVLEGPFPSAISFEGQGILNNAESAFITIDQCLLFELESVSEPATCFNNADGLVEVIPVMGEAPFIIEWENGHDDPVLENVLPGLYSVTVTDANECVQSGIFEVGFLPDLEAPVVNCSVNEVVVDAEGSCAVSISDYSHLATASDNCTAEEDLIWGQIPSAGLTQIAESITVFITATDESGNTGFCSFLLNLDNFGDEPALDCPPSVINISNDPGVCEAFVDLSVDFVVGCEGGSISNSRTGNSQDASGIYPLGSTEVLFELTVEDEVIFTCETTVVVEDTDLPQPLTGSPGGSLNPVTPATSSAAACEEMVVISAPVATTSCNNSIYATPSISDGLVNGSNPPEYQFTPESFSQGITVIWTFTNPNNGQTVVQTQFIQVVEPQGPVIQCPSDTFIFVGEADCEAPFVPGNAIASDDCSEVVVSNDALSSYPVGAHIVIYTATNEGGVQTQCTQTVTAIDTVSPTLVCPPDLTLTTNDGSCTGDLELTDPSASDNCGIASLFNDYNGILELGENVITFTATDHSANSGSCNQTITLNDTSPPTISCPEDVTISTDEGSCYATGVAIGTAQAEYACGEISSVYTNAPEIYNPGLNTVIYTALAENGQTAQCSQLVEVIDTEAPVITCPSDVTVEAPAGSNEFFASLTPASAIDNCDLSISNNYNDGGADASDIYPVGTTSVLFIAMDEAGLSDSCSITVLINADLIPDTVTISGNVATAFGFPVEDTEMKMGGGSNFSVFTDEDGDYTARVLAGFNTSVIPERNFDWMNGVTTLDLVLTQRHILLIDTLEGPYVLIGMDANRDGMISTFDLVLLQNLIIEGNPAGIPGNTSFRFVPADYQFSDPQDPFADNFPEFLFFQAINDDKINQDFIAIKVGDANGDAMQPGSREYREEFYIRAQWNQLDDTRAELVFKPENLSHLSGYQLELEYNPNHLNLINTDFSHTQLQNMSASNFFHSGDESLIRANWWMGPGQLLTERDEMFRMVFEIPGSTNPSELNQFIQLKAQGTLWSSEVYSSDHEVKQPILRWVTESVGSDYVLHQNEPNPFAGQTSIPFELPSEMEVGIEVLDAEGRLIHSGQFQGEAGFNTYRMENIHLSPGIYFYRIITEDWSGSRKMISVE